MSIRPSKQKQHSEQVRTRIIDTAMTLFQEYGFDNVSVKDIAAAMDVTTGTLYHHFKSKYEIMDAVFAEHRIAFDQLLAMYESSADPLRDLLEFLGTLMAQQLVQDGKEYTKYRMLTILKFEHADTSFEKCISTLAARAAELGQLNTRYTTAEITDLLLSVYRSSAYQYGVSAVPFDVEKATHRRIEMVLSGLANGQMPIDEGLSPL